jgi:hypothetical protein
MLDFLKIFIPVFSALMFVNLALGFINNPLVKIFAALVITGLALLIFVVLKFGKGK